MNDDDDRVRGGGRTQKPSVSLQGAGRARGWGVERDLLDDAGRYALPM
jgi:hypothetical protein